MKNIKNKQFALNTKKEKNRKAKKYTFRGRI